MIVMKFGGSSIADEKRIRCVAKIIQSEAHEKPVVVLSAMGDTTDWLLEAGEKALRGSVDISRIADLQTKTAKALQIESGEIQSLLDELSKLLVGISMIRELTNRTRDYLVSFGERLSVRMIASYLNKLGTASKFFDAWDIGIKSNSHFTSAELSDSVWRDIPEKFLPYTAGRDGAIPIVTGFIAKDSNGDITTLGRGGSDLTATIIGSALHVKEIQTWKDVDGIMTSDPRICKDAQLVPEATYEEAQELAFFGAQVLHPRSMIPCIKTGTVVRVKNSYNTASCGTVIVEKHTKETPAVCAITGVKNVALIDIVSTRMLGAAGFLAHIFNQFLKWNVSIDVIATSEVSVSLTVSGDETLDGLVSDLKSVAAVSVHRGKAIVSVICDASHSSKILEKAFASLSRAKINVQMISQGASKVNISFLVDETQADDTVRILHGAFFSN